MPCSISSQAQPSRCNCESGRCRGRYSRRFHLAGSWHHHRIDLLVAEDKLAILNELALEFLFHEGFAADGSDALHVAGREATVLGPRSADLEDIGAGLVGPHFVEAP